MALHSPSSADDADEGFQAISTYLIHSHSERHRNHCATVTPATTSFPTCQPPTTHHHALPVKTPPALPVDTYPTSSGTFTSTNILPDLTIAVDMFKQRILEEFCLLLKLLMLTMMTPKPSLPPHQADVSPTPPPQTPIPTTVHRREPVDPNRQTHRNTNKPAQLTPTPQLPMPQQPTPQMQMPQLQTLQLPMLQTSQSISLVPNQPVTLTQPPTPFTNFPTAAPL